jgi:glutamate N-acetyltransferase/amino-acid N-acetyltransferase
MKAKDISIRIVLHSGTGRATVWTCDLSAEYVRINADYRT